MHNAGMTVVMAQVATWLDDEVLAVGRWDGTLTLFRLPAAQEYGPTLLEATALPSRRAPEMIADLPGRFFVTSNAVDSLAVWDRADLAHPKVIAYGNTEGAANSAALLSVGGRTHLVTGHENGFVVVWAVASDGRLSTERTIDVRSPAPVPSPYPLKNVRGVAAWGDGLVVTGSEDGDIALVDAQEGTIKHRMRYNEGAQRGINSISVLGDRLLVSNCSVGPKDSNLWLYRVEADRFLLLDHANLKRNEQAAQVFNFSSLLAERDGLLYYFAATQEGLLWAGRVGRRKLRAPGEVDALDITVPPSTDDELAPAVASAVAPDLGAALAWDPEVGRLAAVAYSVLLYQIASRMELLDAAMVGS